MSSKRSGDSEREQIHSLQAVAEYLGPLAIEISKMSILEALEMILLHAPHFGLVQYYNNSVVLLYGRLLLLLQSRKQFNTYIYTVLICFHVYMIS